jgi:peptide/nickel transport system permease protein
MKQIRFVVQKLLVMIPIILVVSFLVFFLLRLSGTDPVTVMLDTKPATPELIQTLREQNHLDEPLFLQYLRWLRGVATGDLGVDYIYKQEISMLIASRIPVTVGLVALSSLFGTVMAILLGVLSALNRNGPVDKAISMLMLILSSAPSFVVSILFLVLLSRAGVSFVGSFSNFGEYLSRITIPALVMSLHMVAMLGRVTRSSMITQLQSPYMTTAAAKGLPLADLTFKHAFRNAVIPVLTIAGMMIAGSVGGTVLIEQIFSLPGVGGLLVEGVQRGNFPVVQILVLFMLVIYLGMSFLVDVLYGIVDPRVGKKGAA